MDYEKRNKEILEKLRTLRVSWSSTNNRAAKEIEEAIPELIESEDERIRKEIIDFATKANNGVTSILANNYNFNKWVALIEKRAEQKTVVIIPKFRVGDTIRINNSNAEYTITEISDGYYRGKGWCLDIAAGDECGDYELVEQKPTEWSDEDENIYNAILDTIYNNLGLCSIHREWFKNIKERLKSLRPRLQWKPSDEQIGLLQAIVNAPNNASSESCQIVLKEVIKQLKKLKD